MATPTTRRRPARIMGLSALRQGRPWRAALDTADLVPNLGAVALVAALILAVVAKPSLVSVALGFIAVLGLAQDRRFGPLGAGLLVLVAVPYGRAAENNLTALAGIPLRAQDGAILATVLLLLPRIRLQRLSTAPSRLLLAWLAVGAGAMVLGIVADQGLRDIFRDVRWWGLYGSGLLAVLAGIPRSTILRGLLVGVTIYAILLVVVALLPAFKGGLKDRAMTYDFGDLRLQFSNSIFVVVGAVWAARRFLSRPTPGSAALLVLLVSSIVLSLTRMSLVATIGGIGAVLLGALIWSRLANRTIGPPASAVIRRGIVTAVLVGLAVAVGAGAVLAGEKVGRGFGKPASTTGGIDRIILQDPTAGLAAIGRGRITTYRTALDAIVKAPVIGTGLGTLVAIPYTFGGSRPSTPGKQPGVDDAYLTVALKAGIVGTAVFLVLMLYPLALALRRRTDRQLGWFVPAWLAVLALTVTQAFATTGYGPFGLGLLLVFLVLPRGARVTERARWGLPTRS